MDQRVLQIAEGLVVQTSRLWDTNSVVVAGTGPTAKATLVVDPGWFPDEIARLQAAARAATEATPPDRATSVLFTHGDFDHVVGWEDFPGSQLIAHPKAAERDPSYTEERVARLDRRNGTIRPRAYRYPPVSAFTSPDSLPLGGGTALFFPAPGHQDDCLFTVLPEQRVLIAGDYLSDQEFPFIYHSLRDYRTTLLLARGLCKTYDIQQEVPGHGQVARAPDEIQYRISTDLDYLDRLEESVAGAKLAGMDVEEAVRELADFTFRGQPIAALAKEHAANVRFLYGCRVEE